jgi:hypothetical protein
MADVSKTLSPSAVRDTSHRLLSQLFATTLHPYRPNDKKERVTRPATMASDAQDLRITDIKPAGEVVHIFSHIKKTYRIQWVVLEGGGNNPPPAMNLDIGGGKHKRERKKKQASRMTVEKTEDTFAMTAVSDRTKRAVAATVSGGDDGDDSPVGKEGVSQEETARWLLMRDVPEAK